MADLSEANRKEWNARAKTYDTEDWHQKLSNQLITFIRTQTESRWVGLPSPSTGNECKLLDYACGPGMVTKAFKDYITHATGVDVSDGMVAEYNSRMEQLGIPNASAVVGNFLSETATPSVSEYSGFSIAAVGLGFHHFHDSKLILARLAERVRPGGVVLILDWLPTVRNDGKNGGAKEDGGHDHGQHKEQPEEEFKHMRHTIAHNGFDREMMQKLYEDVGLVDYDFVTMDEPITLIMGERKVNKIPFLSRGRKPAH